MKSLYAIVVVMAVLVGGAWGNSAPVVSNVMASQRTDGSGIVDIAYTLSDADNDQCTISVEVSDDGGSTWTITPSAGALSGDLTDVYPGNRHISWNSKADIPGAFGSNYRVKVTADDGVVAYYPLDGDPNDMSGNAKHGIEHGGLSYVQGRIGQAAKFNGSDAYIEVEDTSSVQFQDQSFTLSIWVHFQGSFPTYHNHILNLYNNSSDGFWLAARSDNTIDAGIGNPNYFVSTGDISNSSWNHIVVAVDAILDKLKLYVNGQFKDELDSILPYDLTDETLLFYIGGRPGVSQYHTGWIDDLRIYDRPLSEQEIAQLYQAGQLEAEAPGSLE